MTKIVLVLIFFIAGILLSGCVTTVPLNSKVGHLGIRNQLPLNVALKINENIAPAPIKKNDGCVGNLLIPMRKEVEKTSLQAFSQIFESIEVVKGQNNPTEHDITLELSDLEFKIDSNCGGAVAATVFFSIIGAALSKQSVESSLGLKIEIFDKNNTSIYLNKFNSGVHSKTFGGMEEPSQNVGAVVSEALNELMEESSRAIANSQKVVAYAKIIKKNTNTELDKKLNSEITHGNAGNDIWQIPDYGMEVSKSDVAIVVGIERYSNLPLSDFSSRDATLAKQYFNSLGVAERNVELLLNEKATQSSIKKTIETWLPNIATKDSRVFIYYSGHGAPEVDTGDSYLVPYDGDPNYLEDTGYSLRRMYGKLGKLDVKEVVVVLDSCFSGSGGRSVLAKGARDLVITSENLIIPKNMVVISASSGSQISSSSQELGHGIFTYYFLKAIKEGKKNIAEIYEYIKPLIENEAKRLNVTQSPKLSPEPETIMGRFQILK